MLTTMVGRDPEGDYDMAVMILLSYIADDDIRRAVKAIQKRRRA
jgi:hypothetical protein